MLLMTDSRPNTGTEMVILVTQHTVDENFWMPYILLGDSTH